MIAMFCLCLALFVSPLNRRADLRQRTRLCVPTRLGHKNIRYTELAPDRLKNFWR